MKKLPHFILYGAPLLVIVAQMCFSQFSTLNRWKGGGFGMYTSPHPQERSILMEARSENGAVYKKVYPFSEGKPDSSFIGLELLYPLIPRLLVFPSMHSFSIRDRELLKKWALSSKEMRMSHPTFSVVVAERKWDIKSMSFSNHILYRHEL